jgi:hypothetical protein
MPKQDDYKHKSGSYKRKIQAARMTAALKNQPRIDTFSAKRPRVPGSDGGDGDATTSPTPADVELRDESESGLSNEDSANETPDVESKSSSLERDEAIAADHSTQVHEEACEDQEATPSQTGVSDPSSLSTVPGDKEYSDDPSSWTWPLTQRQRDIVVAKGLPSKEALLLLAKKVTCDRRGKRFPKALLHIALPNTTNKDQTIRSWICYSESSEAIFCRCCIVFGGSQKASTTMSKLAVPSEGYKPKEGSFKKLWDKFRDHERSPHHRSCFLSWRLLEKTLCGGGIDDAIQTQLMKEEEALKSLLGSMLLVIRYCATRDLALQGSSKKVGEHDNGHFLGLLELLAEKDPVLKAHLIRVKNAQDAKERLQSTYLTWRIQNDFITACAKEVELKILEERKESLYYAVLYDSTPDEGHMEQNALLLRFVHFDSTFRQWSITERFVTFIDSNEKTGKGIASK